MKLPNIGSIVFITALAAALEYVASGAEQAYSAWWVPIAVLIVGGIAKGLQLYVEGSKAANPEARAVNEPQPQPGKVRRWLLD